MRVILFLTSLLTLTLAGPISYQICQGVCVAGVGSCYSAAGLQWITSNYRSILAPMAAFACNKAYEVCQGMCLTQVLYCYVLP